MTIRKSIILIVIISVLALICVFIWKLDIPNWEKLDISKIDDVSLASRVYDVDGNVITNVHGAENRTYISLAELPEYVPSAFVSAEDQRFYTHCGVDFRRILGALWHDIKSGSLEQGASTITQQLIKLTHLSGEKTLSRKAQEAFLAIKLENALTKNEILEAYINVAYFGNGAYGIDAAARTYFGIDATELSLAQAATLAGVIKSPSTYAPDENSAAAKTRRNYVLEKMYEYGYISRADAARAAHEELSVVKPEGDTAHGWFVDATINEATEILNCGRDEIFTEGYSIYTKYNEDIQKSMNKAASDSSNFTDAEAECAMVAIDTRTGCIIAICGGREYTTRFGINRAISARRQQGSVIKPISTYAAAIEEYGYLPTSTMYDVKREYDSGYSPSNQSGTFYGNVTMRMALSKSMNAATVDLADAIGAAKSAEYARRFGLKLDKSDENLAMALGATSNGSTPVEMCSAYCALANGGMLNEAHFIEKILDRYGNTIYTANAQSVRAVSSETAYIITDMLKTAVSAGTAKLLQTNGVNIAAKTGTSSVGNGDTADAWTIAYTPDICIAAWMGRDSNKNGGMPSTISGGNSAIRLCVNVISENKTAFGYSDFVMPYGLVKIIIDIYTLDNENRVTRATAETPREYCAAEIFHINDAGIPYSDIWQNANIVAID